MDPHLTALEQAGTRTQRTRDVGRRDPAGLDIAGVTDPTAQPLSLRGSPARSKTSHVTELIGLLQTRGIVADVVLQGDRRLVGKGGDEIAAADLVLRQTHFPGRAAHDPLEQIGRFWAARTPIGVHRRGIAEPGMDFGIDLRRLVLAGE